MTSVNAQHCFLCPFQFALVYQKHDIPDRHSHASGDKIQAKSERESDNCRTHKLNSKLQHSHPAKAVRSPFPVARHCAKIDRSRASGLVCIELQPEGLKQTDGH